MRQGYRGDTSGTRDRVGRLEEIDRQMGVQK